MFLQYLEPSFDLLRYHVRYHDGAFRYSSYVASPLSPFPPLPTTYPSTFKHSMSSPNPPTPYYQAPSAFHLPPFQLKKVIFGCVCTHNSASCMSPGFGGLSDLGFGTPGCGSVVPACCGAFCSCLKYGRIVARRKPCR